mgnify:CR=1 FL=1
MKTIRYSLDHGIATITFDEPDSPVNTMCLQWQQDMDAVAAQVLQDKDSITGILLASAKSTFFAGADLKAAMRLTPADAPRIFEEIERVKRNFRTIETLGKPVVSLLNGTALGGGWEVALVGHYRIAVDDRKTQFGLPEVTLGLLPGASGVTKMIAISLNAPDGQQQNDDHSTMQHCWCCSGAAPLLALPGHSPRLLLSEHDLNSPQPLLAHYHPTPRQQWPALNPRASPQA